AGVRGDSLSGAAACADYGDCRAGRIRALGFDLDGSGGGDPGAGHDARCGETRGTARTRSLAGRDSATAAGRAADEDYGDLDVPRLDSPRGCPYVVPTLCGNWPGRVSPDIAGDSPRRDRRSRPERFESRSAWRSGAIFPAPVSKPPPGPAVPVSDRKSPSGTGFPSLGLGD